MCSGFNTSGFNLVGASTGGLAGKASILKDHSLNNLIGGGAFYGDTKKGMAAEAAKNAPKVASTLLTEQPTNYSADYMTQTQQPPGQRAAASISSNPDGTDNETGAPKLLT